MAVDHTSPAATAAPARPSDAEMEARRAAARGRTDAVRSAFRHELGIAFGPHPRQVLDIYYPAQTGSATPTLVFLHGGGFRQGEPSSNAYHGQPYLQHGGIFVSMGYRLAPDGVRFPDSAEDVELGLGWLREHLADRDGDPARIYLSGHSAGAMLAAQVGLRSASAARLRGLVLISGFYDVSSHSDEIINRASPRYVANLAEGIQHVPEHTILVAGDQDFPAALPNAEALAAALQAKGGSVEVFTEPNADHFAANRSFVQAGAPVFEATRRMLQLP